jgi:hypothetical protein
MSDYLHISQPLQGQRQAKGIAALIGSVVQDSGVGAFPLPNIDCSSTGLGL